MKKLSLLISVFLFVGYGVHADETCDCIGYEPGGLVNLGEVAQSFGTESAAQQCVDLGGTNSTNYGGTPFLQNCQDDTPAPVAPTPTQPSSITCDCVGYEPGGLVNLGEVVQSFGTESASQQCVDLGGTNSTNYGGAPFLQNCQ
jgi:hypothetical protein